MIHGYHQALQRNEAGKRCSPALGTPEVQRGHWGVIVDEKTYYFLFLFFVDECVPM